MSLGGELGQVVDEHVDLGGADTVVLLVDQRRVEGELPQPGEGAEDRDPVLVEVVDEAEHGLTLALQVGVVDPAVPGSQAYVEHLLLLLGELRGHEVLGAAQHERPDPAPEPLEGLRVTEALDRVGDQLDEALRVGVQARRHDRQQRPQLHQPVLHGRAGQRDPEGYVEAADRLVGLAEVVLHGLRLVEHQTAPLEGEVVVGLHPVERVGGDHQVGAVAQLGQRRAAARLRTGDDPHVEARGELLGLVGPHRHHAGRCHHEEGAGARGACVRHERQRLQGLAEPHVVGEDPAEPGLPQEGQPPEAVELVGPQVGLQVDRVHGGQGVGRPQGAGGLDPLRGLGVDEPDLGELVPQPEVVVAHPDAVARLVVQLGGRLHQLGEMRELGPVDLDVHAGAQDHAWLARG